MNNVNQHKKNNSNTLSKRKLNILVLGVSGNVSVGILRVVRANFKDAYIIGSCVNKSLNSTYSDEFVTSPYASDIHFSNWVKNLCVSKNINIILSGVEEINDALSLIKEEIYKLASTVVVCPRIEALGIGKDKYKTILWLKNNNFNYPRTILPISKEDVVSFHDLLQKNLILKPLNGKSSQGIYYLKTTDDIDHIDVDYRSYALQEVIGKVEDEYTVGCFQFQNGHCVKPIIMKRKLKDGHTVFAQIIQNKKIANYCLEITKKIKPLGPLNIQLRLDEFGEPVCFELNVRFSGTTLIRDFFGFKDVVASIYEASNIIPETKLFDHKESGTCIRQVEELFFTDETISLNEKLYYNI